MNSPERRIAGDWHDGVVPANVRLDPEATVETSYSFQLFRSRREDAITLGRGSSVYSGTMFDLGPAALLRIGDFVMLNSPRIICDAAVEIGDYTLISWNAVLMDTYRVPVEPELRRAHCATGFASASRPSSTAPAALPIRIGRNVWIGFEACILPGVSIGEGAVVGTRSVVTTDVPPFSLVAGNPARFIRRLDGG